ncbi:MAG: replication protein RepA [Candidatus Dormibacteria bacterium]
MTDDKLPKPIGQLLGKLPLATLTPHHQRLLDAAALVGSPDDPRSILYQHSVLCQTCLPFRDPGDAERTWERVNGGVRLKVLAGEAMDPVSAEFVSIGLPFGPKARLVLMHINQQAIRSKSPLIEVEDSLTKFVRRMLKLDTGGRTIRVVKDQLARLSAASIRLGLIKGGGAVTVNTQIVTAFDIWFPKDERQRVLWPSTVQLSKDYWESLQEHAVPLDEIAVGALAHSALALDIYAWLAHRLHRVPDGKAVLLAWPVLHAQFGLGYARLRDFRIYFKIALKAALAVYPHARVELDQRGMTVRNSPPPVAYQSLQLVQKPV